ncbi:hypothetical protein Ab1vBOLIVR4_gp30 [Agrobacterium phage OLIVR4]|nr:hypothetical protein Ab1vBOLIVR4_gp30 [Agrobacterium phage OLIVR4]
MRPISFRPFSVKNNSSFLSVANPSINNLSAVSFLMSLE